ncbi:SMP-30/gluconolactonase/LRE family protein [Falsirhodobacter xinxiangensis]|uniref:SMP-30/gluconolactonase/LRE family protein n=1 Tax=Falsirhodobacter xinxiangensis TaxID=2530049 RepID=UPI0010AA4ED5|nr:SMP-30/gluconolactonase/LRE family protein [Rhodobacter xinxiangensis]
MIFDDTLCELGEGPFWHPERQQLFWFDILNHRLHTKGRHWQFDECVSAAGWIDRDQLLIASETGLWIFDLEKDEQSLLTVLEADRPETRSNDGRADPWGGFWIGTMGKKAEPGLGAVWRWHEGQLRKLHPGLTIPNAICFHGTRAYFADTARGIVFKQELDAETGWPSAKKEVFLDLKADGLNPDGAVTDAEGRFWNAQWGAGRVACYAPDGTFLLAESFPASQTSCPAFGGEGMDTLFVTSAREGMGAPEAEAGMTFARTVAAKGVPAPRVNPW